MKHRLALPNLMILGGLALIFGMIFFKSYLGERFGDSALSSPNIIILSYSAFIGGALMVMVGFIKFIRRM